ncbi:acetylcholine receptor subunit alpha-like [Glandiceps talaboti]
MLLTNLRFALLLWFVPYIISATPTYDIYTRIKKDVFANYDKYVRPAEDVSDVNIINFRLSVNQIEDVDEKRQVITTRAWLKQDWTDIRLTWDPANYSDVDNIIIPFDYIWYPDIVLYNSVEWIGESYTLPPASLVRIFSTGFVDMGIPVKLRSPCLMNLIKFPFDVQHCYLKFGMWQYNGNESYLNPIDDYVAEEDYVQNSEWELIESSAQTQMQKYPCCIFFYSMLTYTIVLERKPLFYVVNLVVPCFVLTVLTLFTFYLPSDSGEKMTLGISILLTLAVYSVIIADSMPPTSTGIPLLHQYVMFSTALVMISVIMTTVVINMNHRTARTHTLRPWVRRFFIETLPPYIGLAPCARRKAKRSDSSVESITENDVIPSPVSRDLGGPQDGDQNDHKHNNGFYDENGSSFKHFEQPHLLQDVTVVKNVNDNNSIPLPLCPLDHKKRENSSTPIDYDVLDDEGDIKTKTKSYDDKSTILAKIYAREQRIEKHVEDIAQYIKCIEQDTEITDDWKLLAVVVDRILLIVLSCVCLVGTCVMFF